MKIYNMQSARGNRVPNQFVIEDKGKKLFQSYDSIIAVIEANGQVTLDRKYWNFSATTNRYRNQFLGENLAETRRKIEAGIYKLVNLN